MGLRAALWGDDNDTEGGRRDHRGSPELHKESAERIKEAGGGFVTWMSRAAAAAALTC